MGSSNIEFLSDRRPKESIVAKSRGALRHLDAAHAKLEKLQTWRRQLKEDNEQRILECGLAVRAVEMLQQQFDDKSLELEEAQELIRTQKALIIQLFDELAETQDTAHPDAIPTLRTVDDSPALTARVLAKMYQDD